MYTDQVRGWGEVRAYVYRPSEGVDKCGVE